MNYRPVIFFREIRNHEKELMKNAESILKELGFKFKVSSPHLDDRKWEIEFSDDFAKEIYIEFQDDADELHSPVIIIDEILQDNIETVNGDGAYYTQKYLDQSKFEESLLNNSDDLIKDIIPNITDEEINLLKQKLKEGTEVLLDDIFRQSQEKYEQQKQYNKIDETNINNVLSQKQLYTKEDLLIDIQSIDCEEENSGNILLKLLLKYIDDDELIYNISEIINIDPDDDYDNDDEDDEDDGEDDEDDDTLSFS